MKIIIAIEEATENTTYGVAVPDLKGCFSAGETYDLALNNAKEAIELWCEVAGCMPVLRTLKDIRADSEWTGWKLAEVNLS
jgi:predicted RNase H-like HicB family nuclease